jgi:hypothetical protein
MVSNPKEYRVTFQNSEEKEVRNEGLKAILRDLTPGETIVVERIR